MPRKPRPLVQFNAAYYTFPASISPGYTIVAGASLDEGEDKRRWIARTVQRSRSTFHHMVSETFVAPSHDELLHPLLEEHGIFAQRFFHRKLRERVARRFAEARISLQEFEALLSMAWGFNCRVYNWSDAVYRIAEHIYDQALLRALHRPQTYHRLLKWVEEFGEPRQCTLCGKEFRVTYLPDWIYFGSNGCKVCCFHCPIVETPRKRELMKLIPAFVETCGFIPRSDASPINYAFTSRLSSDDLPDVFMAYARMGGVDHVKKKFRSWFRALAESGALPSGVLPTARGIRCLARDGHVCRSLDEQRIDDWLYAHGLCHEREPPYPAHPELNPSGGRRADWKVEDTFIEYFGLIGDPDYNRRMDEKVLLAELFKIDLVTIHPSHLDRLDRRLGHLLEA